MGYNHGRALKVFKNEWEEKEKIYSGLGMTEEQIQKIYDLDYSVFCSDRCFYEHCVGISNDKHNDQLLVENDMSRYNIDNWIEILDEKLYEKLKKIPEIKLRAFYLSKVKKFSQKDISSIIPKPQQTISRWVGEIADLINEFKKNG